MPWGCITELQWGNHWLGPSTGGWDGVRGPCPRRLITTGAWWSAQMKAASLWWWTMDEPECGEELGSSFFLSATARPKSWETALFPSWCGAALVCIGLATWLSWRRTSPQQHTSAPSTRTCSLQCKTSSATVGIHKYSNMTMTRHTARLTKQWLEE